MCGIAAAFGKDAISEVMQKYDDQKYRGEEGFGFLALKDNKIVAFHRQEQESDILAQLAEAATLKPDAILFHHRMPTSTENFASAAHPLPLMFEGWQHNYYILHNGVMHVDDREKETIEKQGYTFGSLIQEVKFYRTKSGLEEEITAEKVNDSEILGFHIAQVLEGKAESIPLYGTIAVVLVQESKETGLCKVYAMRNYGNPLRLQRKDGTLIIASELPQDESVELAAHELHEIEGTLVVESTPFTVGRSYLEAPKPRTTPTGGYFDQYGKYRSWSEVDTEHKGIDMRGKEYTDTPEVDELEEAFMEDELDTALREESKAIKSYMEAYLLAEMAQGTEEYQILFSECMDAREILIDAIAHTEGVRNSIV